MSGSGLRVGSLFITGANRGIGLEFVKQLTQLPHPPKHIFATCRNPDAAEVIKCAKTVSDGVTVHCSLSHYCPQFVCLHSLQNAVRDLAKDSLGVRVRVR